MTSLDPSTLFAAPSISGSSLSRTNGAPTASQSKNVGKAPTLAPRVDLEPLYTSLKGTIVEYWPEYKEAVTLFVSGENKSLLYGQDRMLKLYQAS